MLEVITGCMYSGKSEELIRRLRRCQIAGLRVLVLKSDLDNRYSERSLATHIGGRLPGVTCIPVKNTAEVRVHLAEHPEIQVLGFDEVQFLDSEIIEVLEEAANRGIRVIAAGLDLDSTGRAFGPMAQILALADTVTKLTAVCVAPLGEGKCGAPATRSYRILPGDEEQVRVGSFGMYEARCRRCWQGSHV